LNLTDSQLETMLPRRQLTRTDFGSAPLMAEHSRLVFLSSTTSQRSRQVAPRPRFLIQRAGFLLVEHLVEPPAVISFSSSSFFFLLGFSPEYPPNLPPQVHHTCRPPEGSLACSGAPLSSTTQNPRSSRPVPPFPLHPQARNLSCNVPRKNRNPFALSPTARLRLLPQPATTPNHVALSLMMANGDPAAPFRPPLTPSLSLSLAPPGGSQRTFFRTSRSRQA